MPTPAVHPLARLLTVTCAAGLITAIAVLAIPEKSRPPERAATVELVVPVLADEATPVTHPATTTTTQPPVTFPPITPAHHTAPPAPQPSGDALTAIAAHFPDLYDQAVAVARCESGLEPGAVGGNNYGLMQISDVHADAWSAVTGQDFWSSWMNADTNAQFARWLYDQSGGWRPWACRWAAG